MSRLWTKLETAYALGLSNLARVATYRAGVKLGLNPVRRIRAEIPAGDFFAPASVRRGADLAISPYGWHGLVYFGWHHIESELPPRWHLNPFTGAEVPAPERPWWQIGDFDAQVGDIKTIWEPSRFDWVIGLAQRAAQGNAEALSRLNGWLSDWCRHNPPYLGPNWKCGQEASIRVMHLALAAVVLGQHARLLPPLQALVRAHLMRIAPTIRYAVAQDNNHGTSEAAALFIGGSWLAALGDPHGARWAGQGRKWLENRAARLIGADGSFSQYSVNYHRVMLDTYCLAEFWRSRLGLPRFSPRLYARLQQATRWLYLMTQPENGDAPVIGANDGARLIPLSNTDYRDYRPSVQLAMALFNGRRAYSDAGDWNLPLRWLDIAVPEKPAEPPGNAQLDDGGYSVLRRGEVFAVLRYPHFRFRPSQADALHLDLWRAGENLLRDAGTYSYNAGDETTRYFGGTASHNTVQFDDRDQMPRLGRFLFGAWLQARDVAPVTEQPDEVSAAAGYRDGFGAVHHRSVGLSAYCLRVSDRVSGFRRKAVLRWRLAPGAWVLDGASASNGSHRLTLRCTGRVARMAIAQGWESRLYLKKTNVPVLEVEVNEPCEITTEYRFAV